MDGLGLELAGGDERTVPEQNGTWMVGRMAARNATHDIAVDLMPVRGKRRYEAL
jgi:hypothetical protein